MPLAAHSCESRLEKVNCTTDPHMGLATGQGKETDLVCHVFFLFQSLTPRSEKAIH